jgi:hypothetical protein
LFFDLRRHFGFSKTAPDTFLKNRINVIFPLVPAGESDDDDRRFGNLFLIECGPSQALAIFFFSDHDESPGLQVVSGWRLGGKLRNRMEIFFRDRKIDRSILKHGSYVNNGLMARPMKNLAQFIFRLAQNIFLPGREPGTGAIDVEIEHGHRGLERLSFSTMAALGGTFQRKGNTMRVSPLENAVFEIQGVAAPADGRRPFAG